VVNNFVNLMDLMECYSFRRKLDSWLVEYVAAVLVIYFLLSAN
jgi:hypothetical protein